MTLAQLHDGARFQAIEDPALTGRLIHCTGGSATVELDGKPTVCDFETADHEWVRIERSGKRRTTITPYLQVRRIS